MLSPAKLFAFLAPYDCLVCGLEGDLLCLDCLPEVHKPVKIDPPPGLQHFWAAAEYDGAVKQLLRAYKFERARDATRTLVILLDQAIPPLSPETLITYIPTATSRVRQRGYDHARILAVALARRRGLKVCTLLGRRGQRRQVGATRILRRQQPAQTYYVLSDPRIQNASVLIIDDICTTGGTLQAAAHALMKAAAKQVDAAVVAQKQ